MYNEAKFSYKKTNAGLGASGDQFYNYEFDQLQSNRKEPFSISIGTGIPFNKNKNKFHINMNYVTGLSTYVRTSIPGIDTGETNITTFDFEETRKSVLNFRVGVELYVKEKLKTYTAFSTDFNGFSSKANILDLSAPNNTQNTAITNIFHFSTGIDWKLTWVNVILGATYAGGSAQEANPLNDDDLGFDAIPEIQAKFTRWQLVLGVEVPFF